MNIEVYSDLHSEHRNYNYTFPQPKAEICALVGDIGNTDSIIDVIEHMLSCYSKVIYVAGNHDYYRLSFEGFEDLMSTIDNENFIYLKRGITHTIEGKTILGCPLWFGGSTFDYNTYPINDTKYILNCSLEKLLEEARKDKEWLQKNVTSNSIVLTHYLPSKKSINPKFKDYPKNPYYLNDCESIIKEHNPLLWIHGHSHSPCDYNINSTRIVANPHGYPGENENYQPLLLSI